MRGLRKMGRVNRGNGLFDHSRDEVHRTSDFSGSDSRRSDSRVVLLFEPDSQDRRFGTQDGRNRTPSGRQSVDVFSARTVDISVADKEPEVGVAPSAGVQMKNQLFRMAHSGWNTGLPILASSLWIGVAIAKTKPAVVSWVMEFLK